MENFLHDLENSRGQFWRILLDKQVKILIGAGDNSLGAGENLGAGDNSLDGEQVSWWSGLPPTWLSPCGGPASSRGFTSKPEKGHNHHHQGLGSRRPIKTNQTSKAHQQGSSKTNQRSTKAVWSRSWTETNPDIRLEKQENQRDHCREQAGHQKKSIFSGIWLDTASAER